MKIFAPAKINLALRVYEKKPHGYHRIETVMVKLEFGDRIELEFPAAPGISVSVPGFPNLENDKNLAVRAAQLYFQTIGRPPALSIRIQKTIPVGGGLGGGSSDAAAVLVGLFQEFGEMNGAAVLKLGAQLGADIPFLIERAPVAFASGTGSDLTPWPPLPPRPVVLVNPGFESSTKVAYESLARQLTWTHPNGSSFAPRKRPENWSDLKWLFEVGNDLQTGVEARFPVLTEIRTKLKEHGAAFAQMSGSGATVFGLFDDPRVAEKAAQRLRELKFRAEVTRTMGV